MSSSPHLSRNDGSIEVQLGVGFPIARVDLQSFRVKVIRFRPFRAFEHCIALVFLLLQQLGLLVGVLCLLVVGCQSQDLQSRLVGS